MYVRSLTHSRFGAGANSVNRRSTRLGALSSLCVESVVALNFRGFLALIPAVFMSFAALCLPMAMPLESISSLIRGLP
jgi:hypothetical protein